MLPDQVLQTLATRLGRSQALLWPHAVDILSTAREVSPNSKSHELFRHPLGGITGRAEVL